MKKNSIKKGLKLLSLLLCFAIMAGLLLTGCGSSNSSGSTATTEAATTQAQQTTEAAKAAEPQTVKFYRFWDESTLKSNKDYDIVDAFQKANPDIKIEMKPLVATTNASEYLKKVDLMLASGEQIDILEFSNIADFSAKVGAGVVEDLKPYADKENVNLSDVYYGILPTKDGKIYSIPSARALWIMYFNKDMLDAAGLSVPPLDWTWDDYRTYAKKLTTEKDGKKVYGSYFHSWQWYNCVGAQNVIDGLPYYKADGSSNFDHPVFKQFMQFRYDLENVDKSGVPYVDMKTQKMAFRNVFFGEQAAMLPILTDFAMDIKNIEKYPHTFKTTFAAYPRADKNALPNYNNNGYAALGFVINSNSQVKDAAYKLIRFYTTEGFSISKMKLPSWKKADFQSIINNMLGSDESLYDKEAFLKILNDPNRKDNNYGISSAYTSEIEAVYMSETEKFFIGAQPIDDTIKNMVDKSNEIINKNK